MKYLMFVATDPETPEEPDLTGVDTIEEWGDWVEASGSHVIGDRLRPAEDATTVRRRGGKLLVTDGPYAGVEGLDRRLRHPRLCRPRRGDRDRGPPPNGGSRATGAAAVLAARRLRGVSEPPGTAPGDVRDALTEAMASERLRIVAGLIRVTGDWDLAEDSVSDAAERALLRWPRDGIPRNPAAWLTTTARRRAVDVLRRSAAERRKHAELAALESLADIPARSPDMSPFADDTEWPAIVALYDELLTFTPSP
jgi:hypothetical protein